MHNELWLRFKQRGESQLKDQLVKHYEPTVKILAAQLYGQRSNNLLDFNDLYQSGMVGLLEAIERYQLSFNCQFKTFAEPRIKGEMLNHIARHSEVAGQIDFRKQQLRDRVESLSTDTNTLDLLTSLSIDLALGFMLEECQLNHTDCDHGYESYAYKQLCCRLNKLVDKLPQQQQQIIRLHYFGHATFSEIADYLQLSKGRISQLHQEILAKLRSGL